MINVIGRCIIFFGMFWFLYFGIGVVVVERNGGVIFSIFEIWGVGKLFYVFCFCIMGVGFIILFFCDAKFDV